MFPELVAPIQSQLSAAETELERLKAALKAKKSAIRGLKKMLREANGETMRPTPRSAKTAKGGQQ